MGWLLRIGVALLWVVAVLVISARVLMSRIPASSGDFLTNIPVPAWWWLLLIVPPVLVVAVPLLRR